MTPDRHDDYYRRQHAHRAELLDFGKIVSPIREHADGWPVLVVALFALLAIAAP